MIQIAGTLLVTPDGQVVLQRRTDDAPRSPGLLSLFGGHMEGEEQPLEAAKRELSEEISLDIASLEFRLVTEFTENDQEFHMFTATIPTTDFEVYEGVGAETYSVAEALERDDLTYSARYTIKKLQMEK